MSHLSLKGEVTPMTIKPTLQKCFDSGGDAHIALLQICMTPLGQGLPSPATMLIRGILPVINRPPVGIDNDQEHYEVIVKRQTKDDKRQRYSQDLCFYPHRIYCSGSMRRWGTMDPWHVRRER